METVLALGHVHPRNGIVPENDRHKEDGFPLVGRLPAVEDGIRPATLPGPRIGFSGCR